MRGQTPVRKPGVLTPGEASTYLGVPEDWINWIAERDLAPVIRLSARVFRISSADLPMWRSLSAPVRISRRARPSLASTKGLVYFVRSTLGGPIKIGSTQRDPQQRLASLQAGSPFPLKLLATMGGGQAKEIELHRQFWPWRLHGEWFRSDATGLRELIRDAKKTPPPRPQGHVSATEGGEHASA